MDRKARRDAREAKHFPYAHGVTHTRPIVANGSHFNSANDGEEDDSAALFGGDVEDGVSVDARERGARAGSQR